MSVMVYGLVYGLEFGLEFFRFYSVICETNEFSAVSTKKIGLLRLSAGIISKDELS